MITSNILNNCDRFFVFKGNEILVRNPNPGTVELPQKEVVQKFFEQNYAKDWFFEESKGYFTVILEESVPALQGFCWISLRQLFAFSYAFTNLCSRALALAKNSKILRMLRRCVAG